MATKKNITETGPKALRGIRNPDLYPSGSLGLSDIERQSIADMSARAAHSNYNSSHGHLGYQGLGDQSLYTPQVMRGMSYGDSMYDDKILLDANNTDIQNQRADSQPWYVQIGAGITKMGILAATTFTDGIVGTIAGLANLAKDAVNGDIHSGKDALWSFINNPFSQAMQQINEAAESALPNYYSEEEQNSPWYTQIGTANFIGDKFLKNLGFTIGAAGAAYAAAGIGSRVLMKKGIRDAFKGVVVNSAGKELKTGAEIYRAYRTGDAIMDGAKLTEDLGKAAKQMKNAEMKLKLLGAITSAAGEGRIEAISNAEDWESNIIGHLDEKHKAYAQELEDQMFLEHPEDFGIDAEGNRVITNPIAIQEYNQRMREEQKNYENARAEISEKKAAIGNSIFGLNLALLSGSNLWQFGRAISGGYTAGRVGQNLVTGSIKEGFSPNKAIARMKRLRAWSNPLMEAQEEMSQASIAEGSGLWGSSYINNQFGSFYGGKIDPDAEADTQDWLGSITRGFANSYGNIDRWEEGFIGGLTGLLGIPKIKMKTKENGKKGLSVSLDGELWQGLRDARNVSKEATEVADYLNKRVQDPEFVNYYQGMIRHNSTQATMDGALEAGDEFEYKNAEHSQMISDAIMFDKAGRLQDLYDMIEESGNISPEDIKSIRELTTGKETGKSIYDGMTDEQVIEKIKKQAEDNKKTVDKYVEISTNLKTLYGERVDQDVLEELTWGMTQVDNWEERLGQLSEDLRTTLKDKAQVIKDRFGVDVDVTLNNLADFGANFSADKNLINEINDIINDQNLTVQEGRNKIEAAIKTRQQQERSNNLALGRNILKMRRKFKASRDRLEKQREKVLNQMDKLQKEQGRLEDLRADELDDYQAYVEQAKATFEEDLEILRALRRAHPSDVAVYNEREEKIKEELRQLEEGGKADIYQSFDHVLQEVDQALAWAEAAFNTDRVLDGRFKRGYDPNSRPVAIGSESSEGTQMVSEAEAEERHRVKEANYNLLFQIMDLKDALNDPNNQLVSPLEVQRLNEKLIDMAKLLSVRTKFIDTYQALSENPQLFQDKIQEQMRSAIAAHVERAVNKGAESVGTATTLGELREALSQLEEPGLAPQILEKLKESDNEELKSIIDEYENIENMRNIIFGGESEEDLGIAGSLIDPDSISEEELKNLNEAVSVIQEALNTAESLDEAKQILGKVIVDNQTDNEGLAKALESILDKYAELSESKRSKKKDKKAKKKVKKRARLDDLDDEESTDSEDEEEDRPAPKKKKKSIFESLDEDEIDFDDSDDEDIDSTDEDTDKEDEELDTPDESKSDDIDIVKSLKDSSIEELDEVIAGTSELLKDLDEKDKKSVKKLAEKIKQQKKAPSVHTDSNGTNSEFKPQSEERGASSHRSWVVTGYEIDPLKDRKVRKAIQFNHPTANALRALGAFEFVDSGRLGMLLNDNPDLIIHYITAPNKEGLENTVLLAIEVTPEVKTVGAINPINGSDGKMYQVVGSLGFAKTDKKAAQNYLDIVKGLEEERGSTKTQADYMVSQKYSNKVSHIYSGRMVKSTEHKPEVERVNLKDLMQGERPHFGIYYNSTDFRTPTLSDSEVVKPNSNNANPREGSIWLMTREADGRYYAKAVQVKRFNNEEWNFTEHEDTPVMQRIKEDLRTLADPSTSDYDRSIAKFDLETVLYFPGDAQFYFTGDIVSLKDSDGKNVANNIGEGLSAEEKAEEMLKELEKLNLRFQVSTHELGASESYIDDLMDSDILSTDLAMVHNVNASFDMPLLDPKTGKPLQNVKEGETKGHTGKRGVQSSLASTTIIIGSDRYSLYEEGTVKLDDEEVTDQNIIDEVIFRDKIAQGTVQPVEGNANLYLGTYSSSEEFGILNGRLKTGEELERFKEQAADRVKKQKEAENRKKVEENLSDIDETLEEDTNEDVDEDDLFDSATEGMFDEGTEDEIEEDEDDDLFADAEESDFFGEEDKEDFDEFDDEDDEEIKPDTKPDISLGETFNPAKKKVSAEFNKLLIANNTALKAAGLTFVKFKEKAAALGIDINSITTQKQFEGLLTQIKCKG